MNNSKKINYLFLIFISAALFSATFNKIYSQDDEKHKIRLKADYFKEMDGDNYIKIGAISKIDKETISVSGIDLTVENEYYDDTIELGSLKTNMDGEGKFVIKEFNKLKADSNNVYNINISFKGNDKYSRASKNLSFKDAIIKANLITKDSINYVNATLIDKATDSIIERESLVVQVKRLFRPLIIGEPLNYTDETGSIMVPVEDGIPGVNGILTLEVVLKDNDDYGTVKKSFDAAIGVPIKDESTFDERTMWSPRNKTPYLLLIIPNLLTFSIWGIIIFLIFSLFKIYRS
jgi:hypothetical protein